MWTKRFADLSFLDIVGIEFQLLLMALVGAIIILLLRNKGDRQ